MWEKYINYNRVVEEMIRRHEDNVAALESLREQLAEMGDSPKAIQYDKEPVQTSPTPDAIVNEVIQRESIRERFADLEKENQRFERVWGQLTEDERQVLETFLIRGMRGDDAVSLLSEQFLCDRATVYRKRARAIERFKRLLFG